MTNQLRKQPLFTNVGLLLLLAFAASLASPLLSAQTTAAQPAFSAATIRPSAAAVPYVRDGRIDISPDMVRMQDVTVNKCIKWAYGLYNSQVTWPGPMPEEKYDITAKTDGPTSEEQMKLMMRTLLKERFALSFHREQKDVKGYSMTVFKSGPKMHDAVAPEGRSSIENSEIGFVAKSTTMQDLAIYFADAIQQAVVDKTGITGKKDFSVDFTSYLPQDQSVRPDMMSVMLLALRGELGLNLEPAKVTIDGFVVDHVAPPSAN